MRRFARVWLVEPLAEVAALVLILGVASVAVVVGTVVLYLATIAVLDHTAAAAWAAMFGIPLWSALRRNH